MLDAIGLLDLPGRLEVEDRQRPEVRGEAPVDGPIDSSRPVNSSRPDTRRFQTVLNGDFASLTGTFAKIGDLVRKVPESGT